MIKVSYGYKDRTILLQMRGHATVEQGVQNLVCAGVSTLFGTMECMVEAMRADCERITIEDQAGDGLIIVTAKDKATYGELVRALMFVITGLRLLGSQGQVEVLDK